MIHNWLETNVVDLKTLKVNTGASVFDSQVESISVARGGKVKECLIHLLTESNW